MQLFKLLICAEDNDSLNAVQDKRKAVWFQQLHSTINHLGVCWTWKQQTFLEALCK